jgi:tartrate dehydratase alpha subunit/fumarate hydratase class I-like protein
LRIVQFTLLGLALCLVALAASAVNQRRHPLASTATLGASGGHGIGEVVALGAGAIALGGLALAMGVRVVRGPDPHLPE